MLRNELKKSLLSKRMLFGGALALLLIIIGGWDAIWPLLHGRVSSGTFLEKYLIATCYGTSSFIAVLFPIVACIPYSISYRDELDCGSYYLSILKQNKLSYMVSKIIATFLSGVVVLLLSCFIGYIIFVLMGDGDTTFPMLYSVYFAAQLYEKHPFLYGLIYVGNAGLQGGVFAVLGLGCSSVIKSKYIAMILPFAYCIFSASILELFSQALNAISLFTIEEYYGGVLGHWGIIIYDVLLLIIGIGLFILGNTYATKNNL